MKLKCAVLAHESNRGFITKVTRANEKECEFRCAVGMKECSFKVRGTPTVDGWKVSKKVVLDHTCNPLSHAGKQNKVLVAEAAEVFKERFKNEGSMPTGTGMAKTIHSTFDRKVSRSTAYRVMKAVKVAVVGDENEEYNLFESYCTRFEALNPGSFTRCDYDDDGRFLRCIVLPCYGLEFLTHSIPVCYMDMAHLKMSVPGNLVIAATMEGNHQLGLIGWAVVGPENKVEWKAFVSALKGHYGEVLTGRRFFFMADRQKGSIAAFDEVFSAPDDASHAIRMHPCVNHVENNLLAKFRHGDELRSAFKQAVFSYTEQECEQHLLSIENLFGPAPVQYLRDLPMELVFRAYAVRMKYGVMTNQGGESCHSLFRNGRTTSRMLLLKEVEMWAVEHMCKRATKASEWVNNGHLLSPYAEKIVAARNIHARSYSCVQTNTPGLYIAETDRKNQWRININCKSCTCGRWQEEGLPCVHACAVAITAKIDVLGFCAAPFHATEVLGCYSGALQPVLLNELQPTTSRLPPKFKVPPGRPRTKRVASSGSREERLNTKFRGKCARCRQPGHYEATCRGVRIEETVPLTQEPPSCTQLPEYQPDEDTSCESVLEPTVEI
jgi:hypothetical protein